MLNLKYDDIVYNIDDPDDLTSLVDNIMTDLDDSKVVRYWNDFCDKSNYPEEHVYSMGELEDYLLMTDTSAYDVIVGNVVDFDCFSPTEDYFIDSLYGLKSGSPWDLVDFDDYPDFYDYMQELIEKAPYEFDCEEVEEEEEDSEE